MNLGISKKVIFFSFLLINFIQPSKSSYLQIINERQNHLSSGSNLSEISKNRILSSSLNFKLKNNFDLITSDKKLLKQYSDPLLAFIGEKPKEIIIQSDKQSEINNVIYAEGNVLVSYRGKLLKADNLIYDKLNKKISAKGNIELILGNQIFKVSLLE